ncbi:hypothetical protein [Devosia submarina]|uniref:hypothetical protein n=1 Tax=Devosia submarina TaxID=1173082 RepID=UPI000D357C05|nr:hypothetical protein [Devosia submarina]
MMKTGSLFAIFVGLILSCNVALSQDIAGSAVLPEDSCGFEPPAVRSLRTNSEDPGTTQASTELTNPSLGFGLAGISDYSPQQPFIDIMKSSRTWVGHTSSEWGAWQHEDFLEAGYLDGNGWLKSMPPDIVAVETLFLTIMPAEGTWVKGRYRLSYEGTGRIYVKSMLRDWEGSDGEIWFETEPGGAQTSVAITQTDPAGTGDYIRNISIVKEEHIAAFDAGEVFNPYWLEHIRNARLVRFMDWMATNNSTQSEWSDRPKPSDYTYSLRGVPLEVMVALANRIGADPWFNMPHPATDGYMRCFAQGVHQLLRPDLKAHVEFSNEVWNWEFEQAQWAEDRGMERWGESDTYAQFYAVRSLEMARIWDDVYGADADQRLVKVIATQTGWLGRETDILAPPLWNQEDPAQNNDLAAHFDAYGVTGYFGYGLGDSKEAQVREWIAESLRDAQGRSAAMGLPGTAQTSFMKEHRFDRAIEIAVQDLRDGSVTGQKDGTLADYLENALPYQINIARTHDLGLIMYEGGTHVVGIGHVAHDEEITAFFVALNYSEQMGALYRDLMEGWKIAGGTVFNIYLDVAGPGAWGSWGALRHLNDANPRWEAITAFNEKQPGWWEERPAGTFIGQP